MRPLVLVLALLAASAHAQGAGESPERPTANQRTTMVGVGLATSLGSFALASSLDEAGWIAVSAPLTSGFAVYLVGEVQGYDGSLLAALGGAGAGMATSIGVIYLNRNALQYDGTDAEFAGLLLGLGLYAILPPIGAMIGYSATARPAVLTTPDGETVPGVALRIGL